MIALTIACLARYLFCCSYSHNVAPKGKFIAFVSAEAETDNPEVELKPGVDLLGPVDEIFYDAYDRHEPVNEPLLDNCFISTVSFCVILLAILVLFGDNNGISFYYHRVMMPQLTLSPLSWMCLTCIP